MVWAIGEFLKAEFSYVEVGDLIRHQVLTFQKVRADVRYDVYVNNVRCVITKELWFFMAEPVMVTMSASFYYDDPKMFEKLGEFLKIERFPMLTFWCSQAEYWKRLREYV